MSSARLVLVLAVVAAVAAALYFVAGHNSGAGGGAYTTSTSPAQQGVGGGAGEAAGVAEGFEGCGDSGAAVAVVYGEGQEKLAVQLARLLRQQLSRDLPNASYCTVSVDRLPEGFEPRVLPLIMVRPSGNISERLERLLVNDTSVNGFKPVKYDVDASFALQVAYQAGLPFPRYTVNATLVVVQGSIREAFLNTTRLEKDRLALAMLSALYAANISSIVVRGEDQVPPEVTASGVRPALAAYNPEYNLSSGTSGVASYGRGYYGLRNIDLGQLLMSRGLIEVLEVEGGIIDTRGHPSVGSGPVHLAIFEDFACPYCAKFYQEVLPSLLKLADEGRLTIHFMDLLVHQAEPVRKMHIALLCYYQETGDSRKYLDYARRIYDRLGELIEGIQNGSISQDRFSSELGELADTIVGELGVDPDNCSKALEAVMASTQMAVAAGLRGTPSFVLWREGSPYAYYILGYRDLDFFTKLIEELETAKQD